MTSMRQWLDDHLTAGAGDVRVNEIGDMMRYMKAWGGIEDPRPIGSVLREMGFTLYRDRFGVRRVRGLSWRSAPRASGQAGMFTEEVGL